MFYKNYLFLSIIVIELIYQYFANTYEEEHMNWNSSILWGVVSLLGSFLFSFIFYQLSKRGKKIIYSTESHQLITNNISNIENLHITYADKPIKNLTSTTIKLKITGKENIEYDDFAQSDPLCLKTDGEFLLQNDNIQSIITQNSQPSNSLELYSDDNSTISLYFDYFKYNSLITLTLFHTGNLTVCGELKKGKIVYSNSINRKNILDILSIIGMSLGIVFILLISFIENGFGSFALQVVKFLFNTMLGMMLIDYYLKNFHRPDSNK